MRQRGARHPAATAVRAALLGAVVTAVPGAIVAPPAAAADPAAPIGLPRGTAAAVLADVDRDGARDVVRIAEAAVPRPDPEVDMVVEVWSHGAAGWALSGSAPLLRPAANASGGFVSVDAVTDGFGLLRWQDGKGDRVAVVSGAGPDQRGGSALSVCCVVLLDVVLDGDVLALVPLAGVEGDAESVTRLRTGTGADALLVTQTARAADTRAVMVLLWRGDRFVAERFEIGPGDFGPTPTVVGETDGIAGEEAVFGPTQDGALARIGLGTDGAPYVEYAPAPEWQRGALRWFVGAGGGLLFARVPDLVTNWRWPRDGQPAVMAAAYAADSSAMQVIVAEGRVALVETDGVWLTGSRDPVTRVLDADLRLIAEAESTTAASDLVRLGSLEMRALSELDHGLFPYVGPIDTGSHDSSAYVSMGNLVTLDGDGDVQVEPIAAFAGAYPVGTAGPDGSWMLLSPGWVGGGPTVHLFIGGFFGSEVRLVPTDVALTPEADDVVGMAASETARGRWRGNRLERTFVPETGMQVRVSGPRGASVIAFVGGSLTLNATLEDEPEVVTLRPDTEREGNQPYEATIVVLTPDGHTYAQRWDLLVLREPPQLSASGETRLGALSAEVSGRASTYATVLVDGTAVALDEGGSFAIDIPAAPWPRDVRVVARDPLGNETVVPLSVVGVLDYRGLPWLPMMAAATMLLGVRMFLRAPRARGDGASAPEGVRLEELDADDEATRP